VAFPTDSGWAPPEEIPGSEGIFTTPTIARDRNGDAWVAWSRLRQSGLWHTHTYVTARTSVPSFEGSADVPRLTWTLSEPAPRSWWSVLRAVGAGDFEVVKRINSGDSMIVTWTDVMAPTSVLLRYKIRRETFDARFAWSSDEATWWPRRQELGLTIRGNPSTGSSELSVVGASSGDLDIRLYDLQGRLALRMGHRAGGSGLDRVPVDFRRGVVGGGVYFVRVIDSSGRTSEAQKLALLK
jgi:hypothetical protein